MKKIFLYAMMAASVLASCSQEEGDGTNSTSTSKDEADRIVISAASPAISITTSTRSTGSVGASGTVLSNEWSGQTLHMFAFEKDPATGVTMGNKMNKNDSPLYDQTAVAASGKSSSIQWVNGYFPRTGAYDIFGYYADDAGTAVASVDKGKSGANVYQIPFKIDGSQDLMIAKAALRDEDKAKLTPADYNKAYSSYTARKGVQPYMQFNHLLTRLVFKLKGVGNSTPEEVYVKSIKVKSKSTGKLVFAYTTDGDKGIQWDANQPTNHDEMYLSIKEKAADGKMQLLDKKRWESTINLYEKNAQGGYLYQKKTELLKKYPDLADVLGRYHASKTSDAEGNLVGEALLVEPNVDTYLIEVEVMQYYDKSGDLIPEDADADKRHYTYYLELKASAIVTPDGKPITRFAASASYTVTINVNGIEKVEIGAIAPEWVNGGEGTLDTEI